MPRRILYLLPVALVLGCSEAPSKWPVSYDLVAGLAVADGRSETRIIEMATPRGRRHLISGWSADRWDRQRQRGFVATVGRVSVLEFDIIEVRPLALRFLAGPVDQEAGSPMEVEVQVNGYPVGALPLEGRPRRYRLAVAESLLRAGRNELTLRGPELEDSGDSPAKWYQLELQFNQGSEPPQPFVAGEDDALMIPYGTRLEYTLMLPPASVLTFERLQFVGEAGGELTVLVEEDGQESTQLSLPVEPTEAVTLPMPAGLAGLARLTLRADHAESKISGRSGVLLVGPAIRSSTETPVASMADPTVAVASVSPPAEMPNILLYVVDTLRADHLGLYGYERPVSPALDDFASQATIFDSAVAQSSWTQPSVASMMTSRYPSEVGADYKFSVLPDDVETLAEHLSDAGYRTRAVVTNPHTDPSLGLMQGFERVEIEAAAPADWVVDRAIEMLDGYVEAASDDPLFLYLHFMDVHSPLEPPAPYDTMFGPAREPKAELAHRRYLLPRSRRDDREYVEGAMERSIELYDGALRFADDQVARLLRHLESLGLAEESLIVVTSDHGEMHWEHTEVERAFRMRAADKFIGVGHGHALFPELVHVPLVLRVPGGDPGRRISAMVRSLDLVPTLLALLDVAPMEGARGRDALARRPDDVRDASVALSRTRSNAAEHVALRDGDLVLVRIRDDELLWDWSDPDLHDLSTGRPAEKERLAARLDGVEASIERRVPTQYEIPPELIPLFEALGYVATTPAERAAPKEPARPEEPEEPEEPDATSDGTAEGAEANRE